MKKEKNGFGFRLKNLRKNAGMTQNELADRLAKSGSAVRMWELGSNEPDINTLVELSSIFDCSLDYLMCRDAVLGKEGAVRTNIPVFRLSQYGDGENEPLFYKSILPEYLERFLFVTAVWCFTAHSRKPPPFMLTPTKPISISSASLWNIPAYYKCMRGS